MQLFGGDAVVEQTPCCAKGTVGGEGITIANDVIPTIVARNRANITPKVVGVYFPERVKAKSVILPEVDSYHLLKTLLFKH